MSMREYMDRQIAIFNWLVRRYPTRNPSTILASLAPAYAAKYQNRRVN